MSRVGKIDLEFGDGWHCFRLRIGELIELQEKCDAGPPLILARLQASAWNVPDVRETIRIGLIGGGATAHEAHKLVFRYVDEVPDWQLNALVAGQILAAALYGVEEEPTPKKSDGETGAPSSPTENSDGATGTEPGKLSE